MFILDKDISAGTLYAYNGTTISGTTREVLNKTAVADTDNFYLNNVQYGKNKALRTWTIDGSGTGMTWNRMSDGTLVQARSAGMIAVPTLFENGNMSNTRPTAGTVYEEETEYNSSYKQYVYLTDPSKNCYDYYALPTLDGGTYNAQVMFMGIDSSYKNASDWGKYITATGYQNWNLPQYTFTGASGNSLDDRSYYIDSLDNLKSWSVHSKESVKIRYIAKPTGTVPMITPEQTALGTITDPTSVTLQLVGSPAVTASWDGQQAETVQTNVGSVTIDLADKWESLSYGSHTILVRSSQGGYQCGAMITFSKSSSAVEVVTNPHLTIERPSMVKVVGDLLVPSGAELTVDVSNNAGDESPQWEPCGEDMTHYFANTTKTADQWGLAVRVSIDNSGGSSNAEIRNSIAAGVVYEREA